MLALNFIINQAGKFMKKKKTLGALLRKRLGLKPTLNQLLRKRLGI
jgi:hypothetical protein